MASLPESLALILALTLSTLSSIQSSNTPNSYYKATKKVLNPIDSCWRANSKWATNRRQLADCAVGFGKNAIGGKYGATYVVTDASDDPESPKPGTLRYGAIQSKPLWIVFSRSMVITLKNELMMNSYKTIDGRGVKVEIAYGPCITIQHVSHIIIHGISIHDCKPGNSGIVRNSPTHMGHRRGSDGDGIDVFASTDIWIDHCYLARCFDGLIDVIHASTAITISNNFFSQHDKVSHAFINLANFNQTRRNILMCVSLQLFDTSCNNIFCQVMLFGHDDNNVEDKDIKVTVAFNHFGPGLVQRMPR